MIGRTNEEINVENAKILLVIITKMKFLHDWLQKLGWELEGLHGYKNSGI